MVDVDGYEYGILVKFVYMELFLFGNKLYIKCEGICKYCIMDIMVEEIGSVIEIMVFSNVKINSGNIVLK